MYETYGVGYYADRRHEEFQHRMKEQNDRLHAKQVAYENYAYYSTSDEERARNRSIWLNL